MGNAQKDWPPKERWLSDGNDTPIVEGYLVGDRKGLVALQEAIQAALDSNDGKGDIKELRSPWSHVLVRAAHPEDEQKSADSTPRAKVVKYLGLIVIGSLLFLAVYGCIKLPDLFK
jgi:hypothetical protein